MFFIIIKKFGTVKLHPETKVYPIASSGAAAKVLFDRTPGLYDSRLLTDLAYSSLFKDLLNIKD